MSQQKGKEVYRRMEQWVDIRQRVLRDGVSKRQILRETGIHWTTLKKILEHPSPPGYQRKKRPDKPKIDPYRERIRQILDQDKHIDKKQRHTAKRIWERLQEEGFTGGYTIVKDAVRELLRTSQEVFLPLTHPPGEAQVDFGHALVKMGGVLRKVCCFVMTLPYSDAFFMRAFAFFGGVPRRITYDNSKIAIAKIIGPRARELTQGFLQLVSHYLFHYHFCLVRRANEKGVVEGLVRYTRQNFLVPVPQVRDFEELNRYLLTMCRDDLRRRVRGQTRIKEQLLQEEQACFLGLPFTPFEACRIQPGHVNSELERKPHALAFAKPFDGWQLPRCFEVLRDRMEAQLEHGTREYIQVLRLLERHSVADLTTAVEKALRQQVHTRDGLVQFLPDGTPWRQTSFSLAGHPHLRLVQISQADVREYTQLLRQGAQA